MLGGLFLIKLGVTMGLVVGLSLVAEHMSARFAGVLAGLPHGLAILLFFIGIEQGTAFAGEAAQAATGSIAANAVHALVFALLARGAGWAAAGRTAAMALAGYGAAALALRLLAPGAVAGALLSLAMLGLLALVMRRVEDRGVAARPRVSPGELLFRAALAAAIVVGITAAAGAVGPEWAGLFSGFPVVTFPLLLIIHARHGAAPVRGIVRAYPFGLTALILYTLNATWVFGAFGMGWGTAAGLAISLVWIVALDGLRRMAGKRRGAA